MTKAVFLDRDGVINEFVYDQMLDRIDTPTNPQDVNLIHGITELISHLKKLGYLVVVVSNQPGMALGKITQETFEKIKARIEKKLAESNTSVDAQYYCFHHPYAKIDSFRIDCVCRKPKPGLLLKAASDLDIDLSRSWLIGDGVGDIQAGHSAGVKTIHVGLTDQSGYLTTLSSQLKDAKPNHIVRNVKSIIELIYE